MALLKNLKGQAALEYLIIISFSLLLAAPFMMGAQTSAQNLRTSTRLSVAKNSLNAIEDAARIVYSQGPPAKISYTVRIPSKVANTSASGKAISMTVKAYGGKTDIYNILDFNVSGKIPTGKGRYRMIAEAKENYVNISRAS